MTRALIPGSFDPATFGHLDIIERAARFFDDLIVAVVRNPQKTETVFSLDERADMLRELCSSWGNVKIDSFDGLLVDFAQSQNADAIVKGLRAVSDFEYELQMAQANAGITGIETLFMATRPTHSFLSSSMVKEIARFGGDTSGMVPPLVAARLQEKYGAEPGGRNA